MLLSKDDRTKIKKMRNEEVKKQNKKLSKEKREALHGASSWVVDYKKEECETTTRSNSEPDTVATLNSHEEEGNDVRKNGTHNNGGGILSSSWEEAFAIASKVRPDDSMLLDDDVNFVPSTTNTTDTGAAQISRLINAHDKAMHKNSLSTPPPFFAEVDAPKTTIMRRKHKRKRSKESNNDDDAGSSNDNDDSSSLEGRMAHVPSKRRSNNDSSSITSSSSSVLVLVHNKSGIVYSAGERNEDGTRLIIGKIVVDLKKGGDDDNSYKKDSNSTHNNIVFESHALKEMKRRQEEKEVDDEVKVSNDKIITKTSTTVPPTTTTTTTVPPSSAIFPYPTNPDDHCETPLKSYEDILPLLNDAAARFSTSSSSSTLKIYDPYYCDGSVIKHLSSLGYTNVYNKKEDCYKVWKMNAEPMYDILITNPPYSEDHLERLMKYVTSQSFGNRAWLLLMPTWVHKKEYYIIATTNNSKCTPFYIVPKKRYIYLPPPKYRDKKDSGVHKKSSPFVSMWYCWGGTCKRNEEWMNAFRKNTSTTCDLARSRSALRDLRRSGGGKVRK